MTMSESQARPHDLHPGPELSRLNIKSNGLPSRPNQFIPPRPTPDVTQLESSAHAAGSPVREKHLPPVPLPSPRNSSVTGVPESFSPVERGGGLLRTPNITGLPNPVIEATVPDEDPLEDYRPEPEEPEPLQDSGKRLGVTVLSGQGEGDNNGNDSWAPPQPEPIVPPLTKVHFACYQSHRSMPMSNNVWYSVPCMTCQKVDQEVRYRCTFCCLRICNDCLRVIQKCKDRSLAEFLESRLRRT